MVDGIHHLDDTEHYRCNDLHILPSYLEGDAEQWYHSVSDTMKTSVSRIKDVLFTGYCPSKLSVELIDINQSETETVDEYIYVTVQIGIQ